MQHSSLVVSANPYRQPGVHNGISMEMHGFSVSVSFHSVHGIGQQTSGIYPVLGMYLMPDQHKGHQCFGAVFRRIFPGTVCTIRKRTGQAVVVTPVHKTVILRVIGNLFLDFRFLLIGQLVQIQFIPECPGHCNVSSGLEGGNTSGLVVGHCGNMS